MGPELDCRSKQGRRARVHHRARNIRDTWRISHRDRQTDRRTATLRAVQTWGKDHRGRRRSQRALAATGWRWAFQTRRSTSLSSHRSSCESSRAAGSGRTWPRYDPARDACPRQRSTLRTTAGLPDRLDHTSTRSSPSTAGLPDRLDHTSTRSSPWFASSRDHCLPRHRALETRRRSSLCEACTADLAHTHARTHLPVYQT